MWYGRVNKVKFVVRSENLSNMMEAISLSNSVRYFIYIGVAMIRMYFDIELVVKTSLAAEQMGSSATRNTSMLRPLNIIFFVLKFIRFVCLRCILAVLRRAAVVVLVVVGLPSRLQDS
jgi:hypothetical protein